MDAVTRISDQRGLTYSKLFILGLNYKPTVIKLCLRFYVLIWTSQNFSPAAAGWDPVPNFNVEKVTILQGTGQTSKSSKSLFCVVYEFSIHCSHSVICFSVQSCLRQVLITICGNITFSFIKLLPVKPP